MEYYLSFFKDNHRLIVENDEDEIEFIITISDDRNCDPTQNPGKEEEGLYLLIHKYTTQRARKFKKIPGKKTHEIK